MKKDGTIAMFQYWNTLRAGRPAPFRHELDPTAIKNRLPDTFILEFGESHQLQFRLAGTNLCLLFGTELRHQPFARIWRATDRQTVAQLAEAALLEHAVVFTEIEGCSRQGRRAAFELLLLPLDGGPGMPRAIGIVSALARPFWLGAHPIVDLELISARIVDPDALPVLDVGQDAPSLAPDRLEPSGHGVTTRRVRHLLVLDGGKAGGC